MAERVRYSLVTRSGEETERLGVELGRALKMRVEARTVLLYGDLGAGKTTLVKGIASAFGIPERDVGSASFVIVAEYGTSPPLYHIDLYRVEKSGELEELGIWDYIDSGGIAVIEWAERLPEEPENAIKVRITHRADDTREVVIEDLPCGFSRKEFPEVSRA